AVAAVVADFLAPLLHAFDLPVGDAAHRLVHRLTGRREVAVPAHAAPPAAAGRPPARDAAAPIAAPGALALVAEARHQLGDGLGHALRTPAALVGLARETEPGQRRADHVEGILGLAAVGHGIGQRPDDLLKLDERTRPTVHDHQWQRVLFLRA